VKAYDGASYSVANSTTRTISNGIISVELLNPIANISVKNGTYILNVQGRKTCNLGDCVNLGQYFGIGE
jgi:thiamine pyrophosphokinase